MIRRPAILVAAALLLGGVLASIGKQDRAVDLSSAREIWADILRDADQIGLQATRMRTAEEVKLGNDLAAGMSGWAREDPADTAYVTAVGATLQPYLRRQDIPFEFHVVESGSINAFALPGGQIFVLRGMMDFLETEAELAAILGHEMSHVDLRHCVERYQYQHAMKRAGVHGVGRMMDLARMLVAIGYSQYQELEADAEGSRVAIEAGYDPDAAETVFNRLAKQFGETARPPATTPAGEVERSMEEALRDYFRTHPRTPERVAKMHALTSSHSSLKGGKFFVGRNNYANRTTRSASAPAAEYRVY